MKARLSVYLDPPVMAALAAYAARRDRSLSIVAEAAISAFVAPEGPDRMEAALSRRLDRQARQIERLSAMSACRWKCSPCSCASG